MKFCRAAEPLIRTLLAEPARRLLIVTGPRQIGKSHAVRSVLQEFSIPLLSADLPLGSQESLLIEGRLADRRWIHEVWQHARAVHRGRSNRTRPHVLAIDEIQKIRGWADVVKGLWDEDVAEDLGMPVLLLGSSPSLMRKGMNESLTGRFEQIEMTHWAYGEMQEAFDFTLEQFIYFGGYPGGAFAIQNLTRWRRLTYDSMIAPSIEKDILALTRIDKPALLKRLFTIACEKSGQIIAYDKIRADLQDAGNTTTLTHYVDVLRQAGLLVGLSNFTTDTLRKRASRPKFIVLNSGLMTAQCTYTFDEAKADRTFWGRLVETAIGAHLLNTCAPGATIHYWRSARGDLEVDFVVSDGRRLWAVEVKSGGPEGGRRGLDAFAAEYPHVQRFLVCDVIGRETIDGVTSLSIDQALRRPLQEWL